MKFTALAALSLALAMTAGCSSTKKTKVATPTATTSTDNVAPSTDESVRNGLPDPNESFTLATVFFELDSFTLTDDAKANLDKNAEALRQNADVTVRLEGHADERGSTQYNLALGDRRATSVKTYLTALGIPATRLEVVSYGEERPANPGHDEAAWNANRRVELAVTNGAGKVSSSYGNATR